MEKMRHNSVGKQKLLTEKIFGWIFQVVLLVGLANIHHYHENIKRFNNETK